MIRTGQETLLKMPRLVDHWKRITEQEEGEVGAKRQVRHRTLRVTLKNAEESFCWLGRCSIRKNSQKHEIDGVWSGLIPNGQ